LIAIVIVYRFIKNMTIKARENRESYFDFAYNFAAAIDPCGNGLVKAAIESRVDVLANELIE